MTYYQKLCITKFGYYSICNHSIAQTIFNEIREKYPQTVMINIGIHQYFVVNEKGKENLLLKLKSEQLELNERLLEINATINELKK